MSESIRDLDTGTVRNESPEQSPSSWTDEEWNKRALRTEQATKILSDHQPRSTTLNPYYVSTAALRAHPIYASLPEPVRAPLAHVTVRPVTYTRPVHPLAYVRAVAIIFAVIFAVGFLVDLIPR